MIDFESENVKIASKVSSEEGFELDKLVLILKKYWIWIPLSIIVSIICGYYYLKYSKPVYSASSLIKLEIQKEASNIGLATISTIQSDNLVGEIELIKSPLVANDVLNILDLSISYYAVGNILTTEIYKTSPFKVVILSDPGTTIYDKDFMVTFIDNYRFKFYEKGAKEDEAHVYKIGDVISIGNFKFAIQWNSETGNNEQLEYYFRINSRGALVSYLLSNLVVEASNTEARTIAITFSDYNLKKTIDIVNAYDTIYLKQSIDKKQKSQEQTLMFIASQIEKTSQKLDEYERSLEAFVKSTGTISPTAEFSVIGQQLADLEKSKAEITKASKSFNDILAFIKDDASKDNIVPLVFGLENMQVANSINQLNDLYKQREMLKISNKEVTIPFKKIDLEISIVKSQLLNFITENRKYIAEQMAAIDKKINELNADFSSLPNKETEYNRLKRFNSLYEKFYLSLIEKQIEYQISKAGTIPEFTILSDAKASPTPISPNKQKVWVLFLLGGIVPVLMFILAKYLLMNVIYSQKQIENKLLAPILGSIPTYKKKMPSSILVVDKNPKSSISESLRSIRTNSDFMLPKKTKQIIGVTSTISGEGKTFFAINYAAILALTGKKVVILDLDMRKPKIHVGFNVDNSIGMSSILSGMSNWRDAIKKSPLSNLDIIPAGPIPPNPNELLLKKDFDDLIDSLFLEYDYIMADNPPIGLVTDASNVFKKCDLSIYVVRSGYTKQNVISSINSLYKSKNYTNLSVIINDVNSQNTYGNKYGYGYGYGYYEDEKDHRKWYQKIFRRH